MKKIMLISIVAFISINLAVAQDTKQHLKPIYVSERVPGEFWNLQVTTLDAKGNQKVLELSEYRNKHLLLDFWACWCGSCLVKFPKLDSLNLRYGDKLQIIPINTASTNDSVKRIQQLMDGSKYSHISLRTLYTVINDTELEKYFPHHGVPHYVWIDKSGLVRAITMAFLLKESTVEELMKED